MHLHPFLFGLIILSSLAAGACGEAAAQNAPATDAVPSASTDIMFRRSETVIDTTFADNARRLPQIISLITDALESDTLRLLSVTFTGSASPEGSADLNRAIASARLQNLERYVRSRVQIPDSIISRRQYDTNWERLETLVEASDMPDRDKVLHIIRTVPELTYDNDGRLVDSRRKHLMDINGGRTWWDMDRHIIPALRTAGVIVQTVRVNTTLPAGATVCPERCEPPGAIYDTVPPVVITEEQKTQQPFYMSVQTNMLYDLLAVPNLAAEFYLGKNWSIVGHWMYAWWSNDSKHRYWRIYGGDITLRHWFGSAARRKPLTGHHLGVYGQIVTYDFEFGGKGQMSGKPGTTLWEKANYGGGIEYGYSLPIASRLNIDFSIGVGYLGGLYYEYTPTDGHYVWTATKRRNYFGPTKAEVSLVWLIGRGNRNAGKGGVQ